VNRVVNIAAAVDGRRAEGKLGSGEGRPGESWVECVTVP
jgi:hypothetical protein